MPNLAPSSVLSIMALSTLTIAVLVGIPFIRDAARKRLQNDSHRSNICDSLEEDLDETPDTPKSETDTSNVDRTHTPAAPLNSSGFTVSSSDTNRTHISTGPLNPRSSAISHTWPTVKLADGTSFTPADLPLDDHMLTSNCSGTAYYDQETQTYYREYGQMDPVLAPHREISYNATKNDLMKFQKLSQYFVGSRTEVVDNSSFRRVLTSELSLDDISEYNLTGNFFKSNSVALGKYVNDKVIEEIDNMPMEAFYFMYDVLFPFERISLDSESSVAYIDVYNRLRNLGFESYNDRTVPSSAKKAIEFYNLDPAHRNGNVSDDDISAGENFAESYIRDGSRHTSYLPFPQYYTALKSSEPGAMHAGGITYKQIDRTFKIAILHLFADLDKLSTGDMAQIRWSLNAHGGHCSSRCAQRVMAIDNNLKGSAGGTQAGQEFGLEGKRAELSRQLRENIVESVKNGVIKLNPSDEESVMKIETPCNTAVSMALGLRPYDSAQLGSTGRNLYWWRTDDIKKELKKQLKLSNLIYFFSDKAKNDPYWSEDKDAKVGWNGDTSKQFAPDKVTYRDFRYFSGSTAPEDKVKEVVGKVGNFLTTEGADASGFVGQRKLKYMGLAKAYNILNGWINDNKEVEYSALAYAFGVVCDFKYNDDLLVRAVKDLVAWFNLSPKSEIRKTQECDDDGNLVFNTDGSPKMKDDKGVVLSISDKMRGIWLMKKICFEGEDAIFSRKDS